MQISMRVHMYPVSTAFPSFSPVFESFIFVHTPPPMEKSPSFHPHVSLSYLQLLVPAALE